MKYGTLILTSFAAAALAASAATRSSIVQELEGTMIFELNDTDQDAEIVMEFKGESALRRLRVSDPSGRQILNVRANDQGNIGLAQVLLESGEPDIQSVVDAYPEGLYTFRGRTVDGVNVQGEVLLLHDLAAPPQLLHPRSGATMVPTSGLVLNWQTDPDVEEYVLELESEDAEVDIQIVVVLPGDVGQFAVPDGLLVGGGEYQWGIAAVNELGNVTVVESLFFTAP